MAAGTTINLYSTIRNAHPHTNLQISPNELNVSSIILIILLFVARTCRHAFGLGTPCVSSKAGSGSGLGPPEDASNEQLYQLPKFTLSMPLRLKTSDVTTYMTALGPQGASNIDVSKNKALLSLFLAALCEPAMLLLLAKRGCPVRPLGAVNVRNRFEIINLEACRELFRHLNRPSDGSSSGLLHSNHHLSVFAQFPRPARWVKRGIEIVVEVTIVSTVPTESPDRPASSPIFRQEFTMLQFVKSNHNLTTSSGNKATDLRQADDMSAPSYLDTVLTSSLSVEAPSVWARLCKDYNPIHFSSLLAKILGQPGQLAHGNHVVGVCIHEMSKLSSRRHAADHSSDKLKESQLDRVKNLVFDRMESDSRGSDTWWMEVQFRRPIVLPAKFRPRFVEHNDGFNIVEDRSGKISVEVTLGQD